MKFIKRLIFLSLVSVVLIFIKCSHTPPKLTEAESNINIVAGNQTMTLNLMKTHVEMATKTFNSILDARKHALSIGADTAQQLYVDRKQKGTEYTFRFWKKKETVQKD